LGRLRRRFNLWKESKKSEEEGGQLRIQTRNIKMNSFAVLPQQFEYENDYIQAEDFIRKIYGDSRFSKRGKLNFEGINEITKHMIKIPIKQYYKIIVIKTGILRHIKL